MEKGFCMGKLVKQYISDFEIFKEKIHSLKFLNIN